jgi:hypothetical protein
VARKLNGKSLKCEEVLMLMQKKTIRLEADGSHATLNSITE